MDSAALRRALGGLWGATTMPALLELVCVQACAHLGGERCWVARVDADELVIAAVHSDAGETRALVGRRMRIGEPESVALRRRRPVITDARTIVMPLTVDERTVGLLGI